MIDVTLHIIAKNEVDKVKWIIGKYKDFFTYIDVAVDDIL